MVQKVAKKVKQKMEFRWEILKGVKVFGLFSIAGVNTNVTFALWAQQADVLQETNGASQKPIDMRCLQEEQWGGGPNH